MTNTARGKPHIELTLQPTSGKGLVIRKGEVLRITQIEGGQAVALNCFNLDDYKEYMSVGHIRREGFRLTQGRFIWSNPPHYRPMMKVLGLSENCVTDVLVASASALEAEVCYGLTGLQNPMSDAIAEFGLTPDDAHDPLNFWRNTLCDHIGPNDHWNSGRPGDHVDLLAIMDVLAVVVVDAGSGLSIASNFVGNPIKLEAFAANLAALSEAEREWKSAGSLSTQATTKDFANVEIRADPELKRDPNYVARYPSFPIEWKEIEVTFTSEEYRRFWHLRGALGDTDEELIRTLFFHWYLDNRKKRGRRTPAKQHS